MGTRECGSAAWSAGAASIACNMELQSTERKNAEVHRFQCFHLWLQWHLDGRAVDAYVKSNLLH